MTMTVEEIIMEYKQAKDPEKQIRIMADQCLCKPSDIRTILKETGVYVSKAGRPKKQPSAPEKAAAQPATPEALETPAAPYPDQEPPKLEDLRPIDPVADMPRGVLYLTPEKLFTINEIKASALDTIVEVYPMEPADGPIEDFAERLLGILLLVKKLEGQGGRNG